MNGDLQHGDEHVSRVAFKARIAGVVTAGVVVGLVLVPDALAALSNNHNETVLRLDGASLLREGR
jgi:hypothetical protein